MKLTQSLLLLVLGITLCCSACTKDYGSKDPASTTISPARTIRFVLYTGQDFSTDDKTITFSLFIRNANKTFFDSALSPMKIKDIPHAANKLVFETKVPNDDGSDLSAGFNYTIENVGYSWHTDTCKAGELFKIIEFPFQ